MDEHAPLRAELGVELADRLQERQRLDVADGAADLGDHEVDRLRLGDDQDPLLDLVGDVRDHLHGRAEVVAAALAPDDRVVDRAGGHVGGPRGVLVGEPLVVAEVEVGLGAVLGDEHLAVLERAHRPRVDVDVGIELLQLDPEAAADQQTADRGGGDPLAERGDDAAGDEDEARFRRFGAQSSALIKLCRASLSSAVAESDRSRRRSSGTPRRPSAPAITASAIQRPVSPSVTRIEIPARAPTRFEPVSPSIARSPQRERRDHERRADEDPEQLERLRGPGPEAEPGEQQGERLLDSSGAQVEQVEQVRRQQQQREVGEVVDPLPPAPGDRVSGQRQRSRRLDRPGREASGERPRARGPASRAGVSAAPPRPSASSSSPSRATPST